MNRNVGCINTAIILSTFATLPSINNNGTQRLRCSLVQQRRQEKASTTWVGRILPRPLDALPTSHSLSSLHSARTQGQRETPIISCSSSYFIKISKRTTVCFLYRHSDTERSQHGSFCLSHPAWPQRARPSGLQFHQMPHPPLLRNAGELFSRQTPRCGIDQPVFYLFLCN